MNKQKSRQSLKKRGYYARQFMRTVQNKLRRAQRIARRAREMPHIHQPVELAA